MADLGGTHDFPPRSTPPSLKEGKRKVNYGVEVTVRKKRAGALGICAGKKVNLPLPSAELVPTAVQTGLSRLEVASRV